MSQNARDDAERLSGIRKLEEAIEGKQPELLAAAERRDAARKVVDECRQSLEAMADRIVSTARDSRKSSDAVFLNGKCLDRGTLELRNESIVFEGWRGRAEMAVQKIDAVETGISNLPPRSGIPFVANLWPGRPRPRQTLLLSVQDSESVGPVAGRTAAVADLADAASWEEAIVAQKGRLDEIAALRALISGDPDQAAGLLGQSTAFLRQAEGALAIVEGELASLQAKMQELRSERFESDVSMERQTGLAKNVHGEDEEK